MIRATTTAATIRSFARRAQGLLLVVGALALGTTARAACHGGEAELSESIGAALGAWSSANRAVYTKARASVQACLAESHDPLAPSTAAAWFRFQAVDALFLNKDVVGARLALAASATIDPTFAWDTSVLVTNTDLPSMIEEAKALPAGDPTPIAQDEALRTYVNGTLADTRPAHLPVLLQVEAAGIGVLQTRVLAPGEDWAPERVPNYELARYTYARQQRISKTLLHTGGALLGAAGVVSGGALLGGSLLSRGSSDPEVLKAALRVNVGGQMGAALLAGSGLTALAFGVGMRW